MNKEKWMLNNKDITRCRIIDDGYYPMMQIIKSFDEKSKMITFSMWDDFKFEGCIRDLKCMDESKEVEFEVDMQDPLYSNFNKLLGSDEEIIIDDDHTFGENIKTMKISRNSKGIIIAFKNDEEKPQLMCKFNVFVKNIMEDNRSKLFARDGNIKYRLIDFFNGVRKDFLEKEKETEGVLK